MTGADDRFAIVAGAGALPLLVASTLRDRGCQVQLLGLPGADVRIREGRGSIDVGLSNIIGILRGLSAKGWRKVVFAGAVDRSDPDVASLESAAINLSSGDDAAVRSIVRRVEDMGYEIVGPHVVLPELLEAPGVPTKAEPGPQDEADASRAAEIAHALGRVDVGQAVVVARGKCLAVETAGTDLMLEAAVKARRSVATAEREGLLYKAPKPGQELRIDMPAIGLDTVENAAAAGLSGIAIEAGGVMVIDREAAVAKADALGLFIWSRPAQD